MQCIYHPDTSSVGTCDDCSRPLCQACIKHWEPPACARCLIRHLAGMVHELTLGLVFSVVFFILGFFLYFQLIQHRLLYAMFVGFVSACAFWGYSLIHSKWQKPDLSEKTTSMRYFGYSLYYCGKVLLAILVGIVVGPYHMVKLALGLKKVKALQQFDGI